MGPVEQERNRRRVVGALLFDTKGAYENVAQDAIMDARETMGVGSQLFTWISSNLIGHTIFMFTACG